MLKELMGFGILAAVGSAVFFPSSHQTAPIAPPTIIKAADAKAELPPIVYPIYDVQARCIQETLPSNPPTDQDNSNRLECLRTERHDYVVFSDKWNLHDLQVGVAHLSQDDVDKCDKKIREGGQLGSYTSLGNCILATMKAKSTKTQLDNFKLDRH